MSERKSRYLADIGHEIRTPMNAILGFTEIMEKDEKRARSADHLATIRDSVRGLIDLLNGMLDVSKAEAGRLELEYRDVDVNALIEEMFRLFAPQTFAKGVELLAMPAPTELAGVRADAMRLKQILVNLLSNAIRFTSRGYIRIGTEITARTESHVRVCFLVEDTGCGIPDACQPQLFEAFMQGERAVSDPRASALETGTGLGLSIASELAALLGGRIEFRSQMEQGSTFWLTLDLARAHQTPATLAPPTIRRRVALIDRDEGTRQRHGQLMARAGVEVELMDEAQWANVTAPDCFDAIVVAI
ncbi:MAG: ATP-binding protein, partial [Halofilum sp. (in: g-proteobacteria)]